MSLRQIEITVPASGRDKILATLKQGSLAGAELVGIFPGDKDFYCVKLLLNVRESEGLMDMLERSFMFESSYRFVILPVEATLPRLAAVENAEDSGTKKQFFRVSREELYTDVVDAMHCSVPYVVMVILSSIVAAIGLLKDNQAVIIGAMVIAPLLGPHIGMALSTTLGEGALVRKSLGTATTGVVLGFAVAFVLGMFVHVDPDIPSIASRTLISPSDLVLALISGTAGIMAFTQGAATSLVGVMVALALMPPLVVSGLLAGSGNIEPAFGAALLCLANIISLNLAGVVTLVAQGVGPAWAWEQKKARKGILKSLAIWMVLLLLLVLTILAGRNV